MIKIELLCEGNNMNQEKKILLIDDSVTFRRLVIFHLKGLPQIKVVEAANGLEAVVKLSMEKFDLVITDIVMPEVDGLKLINYVKSNSELQDIPVIILTTKGQQEEQKKGLELGAQAYIPKPINASDLLKTVKEILKAN